MPLRTVSAEPTIEAPSTCSSIICAAVSSVSRKPATGGGSLPGRPVLSATKACSNELNSSRASSSVAAATMLAATMAWGRSSCSEGRNPAR